MDLSGRLDLGDTAILCNIAWDNARSPAGEPIAPRTHRKLARIPQQNTGDPQLDQPVNLGSATDLTYHADLALLDDQGSLSDGSKGYQQQQVYIQTGISPHLPDQRTWLRCTRTPASRSSPLGRERSAQDRDSSPDRRHPSPVAHGREAV